MPIANANQTILSRRVIYFWRVYALGAFLNALYLIKVNLQYHFTTFNIPFLSLLLFISASPLLYRKTRNIYLVSGYLWFFLTVSVFFHIYFAGGNQAPGSFWLTAIPVVGVVFFGTIGGWIGNLIVVLLFSLLYLLESKGTLPISFVNPEDVPIERAFNLAAFMLFVMGTIQTFAIAEQKAYENIDEQKQEVDNLLRLILHDIASPVSILQNYLERYTPNLSHQDFEKYQFRMSGALKTISNILVQVRHLRSLKDGKLIPQLTAVDLQLVIKETLQSYQDWLDAKDLKIEIKSNNEGMKILTDEVMLKTTVLGNILSNAIKFSPRGGTILFEVQYDDHFVRLSIEDHGIGIPQNLTCRLFDAHAPTTRLGTDGEKGTGYGMPLVYEFLKKMKGRIEVTSTEKSETSNTSGTRVTLWLPVAIELAEKKI